MANKKVTELQETTNITNSDYLLISQGGESKKIKANTFSTKTEVTQQIQNSLNGLTDDYATKEELNELKTSVSDGKILIADAITDKGVPTSATDTFQTMANNIRDIESTEQEAYYGSIVIDKTSVTINNVETDYISVSLSQRPSANQVVTLTTGSSNISLSSYSLTFTTSNWNVAQNVIVSHNSSEYTDYTSNITLSSPNVSSKNVTVIVVNSELITYGNISINTSSLSFTEDSTATFTVKLESAPTSTQVVNLTCDNNNITLSSTSLTFTPLNYNTPQTITVSSSVSGTGSITLSSNNVTSKSISVTVKENVDTSDGIEIRLSENNVSIKEGESHYVSYTLNGEIAEGERKTLTVTCSDTNVNFSPSNVSISSSDINNSYYLVIQPQQTSNTSSRSATITLSGDGFKTTVLNFTITNDNTGGSSTYGEILLDTTSVSITDNSTARIGISLDTAPSSNQLVRVSVNNSYSQVDKTGLTFTTSNYSTTQYITVSLGSALTSSEEQTFSSIITLSSNNVSSKTVNVSVTVSGSTTTESYGEIIVNNTILSVNESNSTSFTVKLDKAPTNNQTVNIYVNSSDVATVEPTSITFTPYNYNSTQTIIVYGTKDSTSYVDKSTQITVSSNNVSSKYLYLTVKNTDTESGGGGGDSTDTDTYLPLEDSNVRNLVPYLSTYYIKPTVAPNEEIILNYFVTDYYGRSYTNNSNFYNYKIIVKRDGKTDIVTRNVSAGDHSVSLGSYSSEGTYHFSIVAVDQYGRYSHELFNYVRVQNSKNQNAYTVTSSDLSTYSIVINNDKEEKQYVTVSTNFNKIENDTQKATVQSAIDNAYNNGSASSGKYKVFIPMFGASSGTNYKGKTNGWKCLKVKYGSGFDTTTYLNQCATNRQNLQRLINDKANAGYNKIILPNATYMIDNNPIDIPSGVTLDLGGSTIKMCPITGNGALMMRMTDCTDTHLCNGTIEGDYFAHDYANSTSNSEWVSGVEMAGSCRYCSVRDLTIKNITGYGLQNSISSTSVNGNTFYGAIKVGNLEQGDIDRTTGQNISCSYRLRSNQVNISAYQGNADFISMSIHLNYQGNEFNSWNYFMYFYDSGNNFIKAVSAYQYRQVKIPTNAYYARIVILGERLKSNWELHYQFFRVPTHCEFRNITIDNARCVGMAQGQMKDFLVQDCIITNSGQSSATCSYDAEDGWDGMQDAFFENFRIYDCPNNGFLTCAGHNFVVNNMHSDAIYMWERTRWAVIKNSTFDTGCIIRGGGEANIVQHGVTRFYNNTVSAPDYSNYLFMTVAKNCTYQTAPKNGIMVDSSVNGNTVSRTVYNNDSNNQIIDDIGTKTDNIDYGNTGSNTISVNGVSLNITSKSLSVGSTVQLVAYVSPSNATNQGLTWTTSSSAIASVSSSGLVTANGSGSATITVTTNDGNYQATCSVVVNGSSGTGIITGNQGFNDDGSLDGHNSFTHTETYIPFSGNTDKTVEFGTEGWTMYIFYDENKNVIGNVRSGSTVTSITMAELQSKSPNAAYVRVSINKSTTISLTGGSGGGSTTSYNVVVPSSASVDSGNNLYITYSVDNTLPSDCSYELRYNGSYLCSGALVSTNRVNMYTENLSTGTYNNATLVISYNGSVIATSNAFTLTINQSSVVTTAALSPVSCAINVGDSQTFTLVNTSATISNCYVTTGKGTISNYSSTSIIVQAVSEGTEYLNVVLSDSTSLSATITISANTTGGGSTGGGTVGGDNSETDANGYVIVKYPATQQPLPNTWGALGDSITAGTGAGGSSYSYANVCAKDAGIPVIYNYGIPGSCMCSGFNTALTDATVQQAFVNRYTEISSSCDLITVLGSVNDHRADVKIGSETSTSNDDFYGSLYNLINGLKASYPNARIVFITPFKISGWDGKNMYQHTLKDFRNAIVTQCNRFQIEVVDLFLQEQFSWLKGLYKGWFYSYDYYHPTPEGHKAIADYLRGVLFSTGSSSGGGGSTTETYGNIITSNSSLTLNENSNTSITISLDKAPTNNQTVYITTDGNISVSNSSLTFTTSNYNIAQSLTVYSGYAGSGIITLSSSNVNKVQINVTINSSSSGGSSGGSGTSIETASQGFNPDGSLDGYNSYTHTETYIPFSGNTDATVQFGTTGWTRAIFYDSSKTRIGNKDSGSEVSSLSMSELQSISPNAVYVRVSINKTTTIALVGGSTGGGTGGSSSSSGISNSSDTALTQQYSSSHEATPNNSNPPSGSYNWKYAPRINPDGSFPNSTWNAFGHWMTTYKVEGSSLYDNVGLLLQNPKAWIWNTSTRSWDVLSSDFEWGTWYVEDFYDDGNSTIANSVTWETGVSGNHSTWVKIKQDSTTSGRCFHPWGYQKNWRNNSAWANNGQPYIVTKIDFKLVKYDENGADNLDRAQLVVNSGGDWWSEVGATWKPDWSTNRDMCVGKYIKATRQLKRAWATNLPSSWSNGLPTGD